MEAYALISAALGLSAPLVVKSVSLSGNGDCHVEIGYEESALKEEDVIGYQEVEWQDFIFFKCRSTVFGRLPVLREGQLPLPWLTAEKTMVATDEEFLRRVREHIKLNLEDPDYGVGALERKMGMSHAQFYRRLERVLGYSGNELIRRMRISRALELMEQTDLRVSEIAYETGFRDPAYFSRVFREQIGVTPTAFRRQVGKMADKENPAIDKY
jgi:AraC-like DNA-binding protein